MESIMVIRNLVLAVIVSFLAGCAAKGTQQYPESPSSNKRFYCLQGENYVYGFYSHTSGTQYGRVIYNVSYSINHNPSIKADKLIMMDSYCAFGVKTFKREVE